MKVGKEDRVYSIINRKNIVSVVLTSLALFLFSFISVLLKFFDREPIGIMLILSLIVSFAFLTFAGYVVRKRVLFLYRIVFRSFWIVFSLWFIVKGFNAETKWETLLTLSFMVVISSLIPLFVKQEFFYFVFLTLALATAVIFLKRPAIEEISFIYIFGLLCILLSYIRYKNFILNTKYKNRLDNAIRLSETDKMTGLLNRRGLERNIESLWPHWIRQKTSVAFLMLDIDFFKKYNDAYGHVMGDECIKKVAESILNAMRRKTDFAARVGGEEFIVCLSGIEGKDSVLWAKRLKADIEGLEINHAASNFLPFITVSMGLVCERPTALSDFDVMYDKADKELYNAKEFGRACISYNNKCYDKRYISDYKKYLLGKKVTG